MWRRIGCGISGREKPFRRTHGPRAFDTTRSLECTILTHYLAFVNSNRLIRPYIMHCGLPAGGALVRHRARGNIRGLASGDIAKSAGSSAERSETIPRLGRERGDCSLNLQRHISEIIPHDFLLLETSKPLGDIRGG